MRFRGASLDFYRKVPNDLVEGTRSGSFLSIFALLTMFTLFYFETKEFLRREIVTNLCLDRADNVSDKKFRINLNITMMDLKCEFASVDVVSYWGEEQNVTQNIKKYAVDGEGVRQLYHSRNKVQRDILLKDDSVPDKTVEELMEDDEFAVSFNSAESFELALKEHRFVFVDYYAMWCSHCVDLLPTWEAFAKLMLEVSVSHMEEKYSKKFKGEADYKYVDELKLPVLIAKLDCVDFLDLCEEHNIMAYPTLQLFVDGKRFKSEFWGDRTILSFTHYLSKVENEYLESGSADAVFNKAHNVSKDRLLEQGKEYEHILQSFQKKQRYQPWYDQQHPGCQLSGYLLLDRSPGNFHIEGRSQNHDINPKLVNLSHIVHHLSFGEQFTRNLIEIGLTLAPKDLATKLHPMDNNVYITDDLHQSYQHHLKVVTNVLTYKHFPRRVYQFMYQSHLSIYNQEDIPEAKFSYDLSPIAISFHESFRTWYAYLTSVVAIVGGTFTVVGFLEQTVRTVTKKNTYNFGGKMYISERIRQ